MFSVGFVEMTLIIYLFHFSRLSQHVPQRSGAALKFSTFEMSPLFEASSDSALLCPCSPPPPLPHLPRAHPD